MSLKLPKLLRRKNPYLFRAKNLLMASDLVKEFLSAHLSSQEETLFGTFLEQLAVFVANSARGAHKSSAEGIDLELEDGDTLYLVVIKSGPNWANSRQIAGLKADFRRAIRIVRTNAPKRPVLCVNGCCYGKTGKEEKGDYLKISGQSFWEFISGDPDLYRRVIEPIGHRAKEHNEEFTKEFAAVANKFTAEFINSFCHPDGSIDWDKLLIFNSGNAK